MNIIKIIKKMYRTKLYYNTYKSKIPSDIIKAYKNWAPYYEYHITDMGWSAPTLCVSLFLDNLNFNKTESYSVLDVGVGTGLVGVELKKRGFNNIIDGCDISSDMLKIADDKKCYNKLIEMNVEDMSSIKNNSYDAILCVGALNFGHISPSVFDEFNRITKKQSGLICFTTRKDYYDKSSKTVQENLENKKEWELLEKREYNNEAVKDTSHIHWCYRPL